MRFDFETVLVREGTDSEKYNCPIGVLPLSIADMDFPTCPSVLNAIKARASSGVFGYVHPTKEWYLSYINHFKGKYGLDFKEGEMMFVTGVVPALSSSVRCFSQSGDNVVIFTPVYNIFFNSIRNNGRVPLQIPLLENEGEYHLDFDSIEEAFKSERTTLCLFCNPQNPIGIIWGQEEMERLAKLAKKYNVTILSDEIHGEIVKPGKAYMPFYLSCPEAKEVGVMATSPTKCFNLAGIQTAAIIALNPSLFKKINRQINTDEVAEPNAFACLAAVSSWNEGMPWLEECKQALFANRALAESYIRKNIPNLSPVKGEATYLLWVDCSKVEMDSEKLCAYLEKEAHLLLNPGSEYGEGGEGHLRVNLAVPSSVLLEGLTRLKKGIEAYKNSK